MKKIFSLIIALAMTLSLAPSFASETLIEATGEYIMDSRLDETTATATARAREEAKRIAIEKAGVYLQTYSKVVDFQLTEDEVESVAAGLLKIQSESSNVEVTGEEKNLLKFTVHIKALVNDLSDADLKALLQERKSFAEVVRKYQELKTEHAALKNQMEELKRNYNTANDKQKADIKLEVVRNTEKFSALEAMEKANDFYFAKNYAQALAAYDEAIKFNPQSAEAYNNRGIVKYALGEFQAATEDFSAAIKLKPNFFDALNNRGIAYAALKQLKEAEQDLKIAVKLNDASADAHNNLGSVYYSLSNFDAAIKEYTRAIQLNPHYAEAYYNRGAIYYGQKKYLEALSDITTSFNLNHSDKEIISLYNKIVRTLS